MRLPHWPIFLLAACLWMHEASGQSDRIPYHEQRLFLSGANLAWARFGEDIGAGATDLSMFADALLQMHDHGGNALRWWLHTDGVRTPRFDTSGKVTGPGAGTIEDIRNVLDLAWDREIGMKLCLWSFDMLDLSKSAAVRNRNVLMLTDTAYTRAYIDNCLIPMVNAFKGHPGIIAWEIFNEPEGMSNEFGWSAVQHVPMSAIQRFINLCTGAIHRCDPKALVTSGAWAFYAMTDVPTVVLAKEGSVSAAMSAAAKHDLERLFLKKYRMNLSAEEILAHAERAAARPAYNYYRDDRLRAAGGDSAGILDFYSVHYFEGIGGGTSISPFHHACKYWQLDKPIVVAEFAMKSTFGVPSEQLFDTLYQTGYAGAMPWSWTDPAFSSISDMLASMQSMWNRHRTDVDVKGIGGDWPVVTITAPAKDTTLADSTEVTIQAAASDPDGSIARVEFFLSDTLKIGEIRTAPFTLVWKTPHRGLNVLTAVATDNAGHQRTSAKIPFTVGKPSMIRIEAERASRQGEGMTVKSDPGASGGAFVDIAGQSGTVTWEVKSVPAAGKYDLAIGYRLNYASPKSQYVNVNGVRALTVEFTASSILSWLEKSFTVPLQAGDNTIQMEMFWGWMYVDYLALPMNAISAPVERNEPVPVRYALGQNFPNPFNPSATIPFSLAERSRVEIAVYDVLGRRVATLADEERAAGSYTAAFDGTRLASGVYLYRMTAVHNRSVFTETRRLMLVK